MNGYPDMLFGPESSKHTAAAIGAFDGLHLGHRHILSEMIQYARKENLEAAAILFDPLPAQFFGRIKPNERILLRQEQEELLNALGVDRIIFLPFSREIADLSPEEFLCSMQKALHCEKLFMGEDFSLGKNRAGDPQTLSDLGKDYHFSVNVIEKDVMDGDVISSSRIRSLLLSGLIPEANRLLGYSFFFSSMIIHGEERGRKLGFPTLNVKIPEGKLNLPNGVYAVYNTVDNIRYASVTNIGVRPTFGLEDKGVFVESYLLNGSGYFYGKTTRLEFIEKLRPEIHFGSGEELREQISKDIERARQILL